MKYILLMSGNKAGVDAYRTWSGKDINAHMAVLASLNAGACLRNCRSHFSRAGSRRSTDQHADRSPAARDPRSAIVENTEFSEGGDL
jgi:hypothetical protein